MTRSLMLRRATTQRVPSTSSMPTVEPHAVSVRANTITARTLRFVLVSIPSDGSRTQPECLDALDDCGSQPFLRHPLIHLTETGQIDQRRRRGRLLVVR